MATAPKTWVEWADFFSKTLIATAGLLVSVATLVLTQAEKRRAGAEQKLAEQRRAEEARRAEARIEEASHRDKARFILDQLPPDLRARLNLQTAIDYCNDPTETGLKTGVNAGLSPNTGSSQGKAKRKASAFRSAPVTVATRGKAPVGFAHFEESV